MGKQESMLNLRINIEALLRADEETLEEAAIEASNISWKNFGRKIRFYAPTFVRYRTDQFNFPSISFPSISLTGSSCIFNCKHCGKKVLNAMLPALTPEQFIKICAEIKEKGGSGCLISGGCLPDGSLPLGKFLNAIATVKRKLGLTLVVHTGIVDLPMAISLKKAGVDIALIDIIGSEDTIREICQLNVSVADYDKSLRALHESQITFVPHVLIGLHYGKLKGEMKALQMIAKYSPDAVIAIAFMPIHGTLMEKIAPPTPTDIFKVLIAARLILPKTPLALGCMRPIGKHRAVTDALAIKAGVNAIAFPTEEAITLAESMRIEASFSPLCCSTISMDLSRNI